MKDYLCSFDTDSYQIEDIYRDWHNDRYLKQCYHNLQEKYDCGGITKDEWNIIDRSIIL